MSAKLPLSAHQAIHGPVSVPSSSGRLSSVPSIAVSYSPTQVSVPSSSGRLSSGYSVRPYTRARSVSVPSSSGRLSSVRAASIAWGLAAHGFSPLFVGEVVVGAPDDTRERGGRSFSPLFVGEVVVGQFACRVGLIRFRGHPTKGGYRGKDGTPNEDTKGQAHIH